MNRTWLPLLLLEEDFLSPVSSVGCNTQEVISFGKLMYIDFCPLSSGEVGLAGFVDFSGQVRQLVLSIGQFFTQSEFDLVVSRIAS